MAGAATPLGNMVIKLGLDDADFGKGVQNAKKQVNYLAKEMQANMKIADLAGNQMGKLGTRYDSLTKIIGAQERQVNELKKAYDGSFVDGKATESTKRLAGQLQQANEQLALNKQQLIATAGAMAEYRIKNEGLTGAINKTSDALVKSGSAMQTAGSALTKGLTVPLAAGVTAVTAAAISWESSFASVRKTVDEATDSNGKVTYSYERLENELRGLAKTLPATHGQIANVAEAAGQLGIKTEDVTSFTKTMIDMGESTNLSAEEAATAIAKIANITGMTSDEYSRFGSATVALGNNFATTERNIVEMANRLAASGKIAGLTEAEILGLATAMSSVGIEAESGGSAMSQTFASIEHAVANGADELEMFAKVSGVTASEFATLWKQKPIDAIQAFIKGLGELDKKGESATLILDEMGLSGIRQSNMLKSLGLASETTASAVAMASKAWEENTALTDEANKRYETTESQLRMLKNEAVDMAIEMGGPFVDALRDGLQAAKPLIEKLAEMAKAFSDADPKTQQLIVGLVGFGAAAGPLLSLTGGLTKGVGKLGGSFVDLLAKMAKKTAVTEMTTALAEGAISAGEFGGAASLASGAKGIGGLVSAIGLSMPVVLGLVGAGGALALGYGAWKLWGEEAYNSAKRTKEWGVDVGKVTSDTLYSVKGDIESATGQLGLMSQGFKNNSSEIASNFETIGQTIENSLIKKIEGLDNLLQQIPVTTNKVLNDLVQGEKEKAEGALAIVQANTAEIQKIRENASKNNRELNVAEASMIRDLALNTTKAYVDTLDISYKEKQNILKAMNGDVANATKEEAKLWLQSLGEQRQAQQKHAAKSLEEQKKYLKEMGYNLEGEFAQQYLKEWNEVNKVTTDGFDTQMALIMDKYPELMNEVSLSNGQLIDSTSDLGQALAKQNEYIVDKARDLSISLSKTATENAEILAWKADQATTYGKIWNELVFDKKTGEVSTNAAEAVTEAAKNTQTWNELRMVLHEANIDSNAKKVIGEAAIANGWWEGMAWADKEAVLQDEFSIATYKALESSGQWAELSFEEKKAILYSNTPDVIQSTLQNLGLWEALDPSVKQLIGINTSVVKATQGGEAALDSYDENNPVTKQLLGNAYPVVTSAKEGEGALNRYSNNNPNTKNLLGNSYPVVQATSQGGSALTTYANNNPKTKNLNANDKASGPAGTATGAVQNFARQGDKTVTLTTKIKTIFQEFKEKYFAKGTNYHTGGPAVVNDQRGSLYRELVELPSGQMFIPEERNVRLNLPRGSKVYTASQTKQMIPHYAEGVGVPSNATIVNSLRSVNNNSIDRTGEIASVMRQTLNAILELKNVVSNIDLNNKENLQVVLDSGTLVGELYEGINQKLGEANTYERRGR